MKVYASALAFLCFSADYDDHHVAAQNTDEFNYNIGTEFNTCEGGDAQCSRPSFAQDFWQYMRCQDARTCTGFPNKFPAVTNDPSYGWSIDDQGNNCQWCPHDMNPQTCGVHKQSPIDLMRYVGVDSHPDAKECIDWHWMQFRDGTCDWEDMKGQFTIERHALQLHMPTRSDGTLDCVKEDFGTQWPRLDYSKGFPDWWWLARTDITTPSQHHQEGFQYAAEITLAHFYSVKEHPKNEMGHVTMFLQDYPDEDPWPFLDKLICQWRAEEERIRSQCGLPPAPVYGLCSLFRGQTRPSSTPGPTQPPSPGPTPQPTAAPVPQGSPPVDEQETTPAPTRAPTPSPTPGPTQIRLPTPAPTRPPTPQPTTPPGGSEVDVDCETQCFQRDCNRMCSGDRPCCQAGRVDSEFCWNVYENYFPGNQIFSACDNCCNQPIPNPTTFFATSLPDLPQTRTCSSFGQDVQRFCKAGGCCANPLSTSSFCTQVYTDYNYNDLRELCHYCCSSSIEIPSSNRMLLAPTSNSSHDLIFDPLTRDTQIKDSVVDKKPLLRKQQEQPIIYTSNVTDEDTTDLYYMDGRLLKLTEKDFEPSSVDPNEYFNQIYNNFKERHRHRRMDEDFQENYDDVYYWPYEWLLKVGTEYYFRYEGTQVVPPCRQVVHWRVMKDPIRVHKRQIDELNRLLAWRVNEDTCTAETAGRLYDNGNKVNVNREIQYTHTNHRLVFCECKDWPSKFEGDQTWCTDWENDVDYNRFYVYPYSFPTYLWLPDEPNPYITSP